MDQRGSAKLQVRVPVEMERAIRIAAGYANLNISEWMRLRLEEAVVRERRAREALERAMARQD